MNEENNDLEFEDEDEEELVLGNEDDMSFEDEGDLAFEDEDDSPRPHVKGRTLKILGILLGVAALIIGGIFLLKPSRPGSELMDEYSNVGLNETDLGGGLKVSDYRDRHRKVLEWIDDRNITSSSKELVTIEKTGKNGTVVEFEIMLHELRVGNDESFFMFPLDGPHSQAACKVLGLDLPTKWMSKQLREKAFEERGKVRFIAEPAIKRHLGLRSTAHERDWKKFGRRKGPNEMETPRFIRARGELFMALIAEEELDSSKPISGHFKEVIQDPAQAARKKLATFPGYSELRQENGKMQVQLLVAERHPPRYFDYSHGVRCAKPKMEVDGETMSIREFYSSKEYRKEFGLGYRQLKECGYKYPKHLAEWMEKKGYDTCQPSSKEKKK